MRTIYKYALEITDRQEIKLPHGAKILHVGMQGETLCLWAQVRAENSLAGRVIWVFGTGNPMDEGAALTATYLGTVMDRMFVWHVYDGGVAS